MKVEMGKQYKFRGSGIKVRIVCTDASHDYPIVGVYTNRSGIVCSAVFCSDGTYIHSIGKKEYDLIEISPYDDLVCGEPVITSSGIRRHFSHVDSCGLPNCFIDGRSDWSEDYNEATVQWPSVRRPTKEELDAQKLAMQDRKHD